MDGDCRSRTSPQHVCRGDSGHIALCNIGQNVAVLNELLLSRVDTHICKIISDMPSRAILASPFPLGLAFCVASLRSRTQVINPGTISFPNSYPQRRKLLTLPSVLVLHGVRTTVNTKDDRFLGLGNKHVCPVYPILAATLLSTAAQRVLRKA